MDSSCMTGSDEVFKFVCKPCGRDNQNVEGVGYCVDCAEYLCVTCYSYHKKIQVLRDHALLDKENMPKHTSRIPPALPPKPKTRDVVTPPVLQPNHNNKDIFTHPALQPNHINKDIFTPPALPPKPKKGYFTTPPAVQPKRSDLYTNICPKHNSELTKFYCNEHHKLACSVCLPMDHRICKDVSYIPDVSVGIMDSAEFQQVFDELKHLQAMLGFEYSRALYNEKRIDEIHKSVLGDILEFKYILVRLIDNIFKETEKEVNSLRESQMGDLTNWIKRYNGVMPDVEKIIQHCETNMRQVDCNQLFIDMKISKEELSKLQNEVHSISDQNIVSQYKFEGRIEIVEKLTAVKNLGKILKKKMPVSVRATLLHELNVKSDKDTEDCNINGAVILPNGDLALSDHHNKSIKIVVPSKNKVQVKAHILESNPFDLTLVKQDRLAVTLPNIDTIQILKISDGGLTPIYSFRTSEICVGIEYHDDKLITVCEDPVCVIIMDMNGKLLKRLDNDRFGKPLLLNSRTVALSVDKSVIYVTEWDTDKLKVVTLDGEPVAEYQSVGAKPLGIAFDNEGVLYLTCGDSHEVHQLSPTCSRLHILLGKKDGLSLPSAIALDRHRDLLYVGSASRDPICKNKFSVFQLNYDWV